MPAQQRLNLARKYRPTSLSEVVGQANAVKVLSEALKSDRIAPAYLFSGPRGTGKTTCARIFARAAGCLSDSPEKRPCQKCRACEAQSSGRLMDLIEIDGASHTGVDDIRSIIEAVSYRPAVAAKTVYIIDEVHMLSNAAFNALLKTLEEPPSHALFLFATTEPEKIPTTILSRVQRIEMHRLKEPEILQNLQMICKKEKIDAEKSALEQVAVAADGGLRDAQTLLEQMVLMSGGEKLSSDICDTFLGTIGSQREIELLSDIAKRNIENILKRVHEYDERGKDLNKFLSRLVEWVRGLLILKSTQKADLLKAEFEEDHLKKLQDAFQAWSVDDIDRLFEVLWLGLERIRKSEIPKVTCETTLIRACRIPQTEDLKRILDALDMMPAPAPSKQASAPSYTPASNHSTAPSYAPTSYAQTPTPPRPSAARTAPAEDIAPRVASNLSELLVEVRKKRPTVHALLVCADKSEWTGEDLILNYPPGHFAFKQLNEKILNKEVEELLSQVSQNKCKHLKLHEGLTLPSKPDAAKQAGGRNFMKDAKTSILNDPAILRATQILNGKIESVTIEGVKNS